MQNIILIYTRRKGYLFLVEMLAKPVRSKKFGPCEDIQLCRIHVHILQDPKQEINQTSATFLQRVANHFNTMDVNNCKRFSKSLESRWEPIQKECSIYIEYKGTKRIKQYGEKRTTGGSSHVQRSIEDNFL